MAWLLSPVKVFLFSSLTSKALRWGSPTGLVQMQATWTSASSPLISLELCDPLEDFAGHNFSISFCGPSNNLGVVKMEVERKVKHWGAFG